MKMIIPVEITIDDKFIEDLSITIFEGGSNYWIGGVQCTNKSKGMSVSEWIGQQINNGLAVNITTNDIDPTTVVLTKGALMHGIYLWATRYKDRVTFYREKDHLIIDNGNINANEADLILQFAVFGEILYG